MNAQQQYMVAYFKALKALEDLREKFRAEASDEARTEAEQAEAAAAFLDMGQQVADLKDAHEAFMSRFGGVTPPSAQLVARSMDLSAALAQRIAAMRAAATIVRAVADFVEDWANLSQAPAAAPMASGQPARAGVRAMPASARNLRFLQRAG